MKTGMANPPMTAPPNNSLNRSANSAALIENLRVMAIRRARLIRAICRFAEPKAVALTQVEGQKQNVGGSFQSWTAYQLIQRERNKLGFHR